MSKQFRMDRFTYSSGELELVPEGEPDEMDNPLAETPELESDLNALEAELGSVEEPEPSQAMSEPDEDTEDELEEPEDEKP